MSGTNRANVVAVVEVVPVHVAEVETDEPRRPRRTFVGTPAPALIGIKNWIDIQVVFLFLRCQQRHQQRDIVLNIERFQDSRHDPPMSATPMSVRYVYTLLGDELEIMVIINDKLP